MTQKQKKHGLLFGLFVLAVIMTGTLLMVWNITTLTRTAIEKVAGSTLGTRVRVGELTLDLPAQKAILLDLTIASPSGFSGNAMIHAKRIDIDLEDIAHGQLVFSGLVASTVTLRLDKKGDETNFARMETHLEEIMGESAAQRPEANDPDNKGVVIRDLQIRDILLTPPADMTGATPAPVAMDDIRMRGIGGHQNIRASEAIVQVMERLMQAAREKAAQAGYLGDGVTD